MNKMIAHLKICYFSYLFLLKLYKFAIMISDSMCLFIVNKFRWFAYVLGIWTSNLGYIYV